MLKVIFILAIVILILLFGLHLVFCLYKAEKKKLQKAEKINEEVVKTNHALMEQIKLLQTESSVKTKNRNKANEKIDELHKGDAVDNALNSLSNK